MAASEKIDSPNTLVMDLEVSQPILMLRITPGGGGGGGGGGDWVCIEYPLVHEHPFLRPTYPGADGRERGEDDTNFERQSALFALAVADVLLVNIWCHDVGREQGSGKPLLKTIFQVGRRPAISFRARALLMILGGRVSNRRRLCLRWMGQLEVVCARPGSLAHCAAVCIQRQGVDAGVLRMYGGRMLLDVHVCMPE
eukprot:350048-Chlamydomonas_euryale.AAC.9